MKLIDKKIHDTKFYYNVINYKNYKKLNSPFTYLIRDRIRKKYNDISYSIKDDVYEEICI